MLPPLYARIVNRSPHDVTSDLYCHRDGEANRTVTLAPGATSDPYPITIAGVGTLLLLRDAQWVDSTTMPVLDGWLIEYHV